MGLPISVIVHTADIQDRDGAKIILGNCSKLTRMKKIWADGGYSGQLIEWVSEKYGWVLEIVKRSDDVTGFKVLPKRWIVERTFAWLNRFRRLSKNYERKIETATSLIYIGMIKIMLGRLV